MHIKQCLVFESSKISSQQYHYMLRIEILVVSVAMLFALLCNSVSLTHIHILQFHLLWQKKKRNKSNNNNNSDNDNQNIITDQQQQ